jgi:broad-specificity NMP kinase
LRLLEDAERPDILLDKFDIAIVVTAYPSFLEHNDRVWKDEKANKNLVANFIAFLPSE